MSVGNRGCYGSAEKPANSAVSHGCSCGSTSNCKRIETLAVFPVNSDIVIVNTHLPPFPLINVVRDLVMIFNVTSNNIERGRGVQKCIKVFHLFPRVRFQLVIQFFRRILQLLVGALFCYPSSFISHPPRDLSSG